MSAALGFLEDIKRHPDDDAPRLIFADWLDEHGDPRGELIRVQCALDRLPAGDARRDALLRRERDLLLAHAQAWLGPLALAGGRWSFRRGLLCLEMDAGEGGVRRLAAPARSEAYRWVESVRVSGLRPRSLAALVASPLLDGPTALDLSNTPLGPGAGATLAEAPALARLTRLHLWNTLLGDEGARALAASPNLGGLTRLDMMANAEIDEPGWRALRKRYGPALVAPAGR